MSSTLNWVDCDQKRLFRFKPESGDRQEIALPGNPGCYAFCGDDRLLMAYRTSLTVMDTMTGVHTALDTSMIDFSKSRFNDGACDRYGRFWVGTMHKAMSDPVGGLYRVDKDLSVRQMEEGFTVSNGIAFSPDDTVMYQVDSRISVIYAYDYDLQTGSISHRRVFADLRDQPGRPDGCTTDREGNLWVAMLGAGCVAVFNPAGERVGSLAVPTSRVTSVCFGGAQLDTLYVTSMRFGLSEEERAAQPLAGCLFAFQGVGEGIPELRFG